MKAAALSLALALAVPVPGAAAASGLCERLDVPAELGLVCTAVAGSGADAAVSLEPAPGGFSALSRLTLRRLDPAADPLAWGQPDEWLRRQLVVDTTSLADAVDSFADDPDSPWAGPTAMLFAESVREALENAGRSPLRACEAPTKRGDGRAMRCRYGMGGFGLQLELRLVEAGDQRYAITFRSMNDRRQRHFEAIANSFGAD